jgi:hypothetical protein
MSEIRGLVMSLRFGTRGGDARQKTSRQKTEENTHRLFHLSVSVLPCSIRDSAKDHRLLDYADFTDWKRGLILFI